jgi:hypothetical protein
MNAERSGADIPFTSTKKFSSPPKAIDFLQGL